MEDKRNLKNLYSAIREILFKMIPEKWDSIYLYASVIEDKNHNENGEMFFYYFPKSILKKNPVNVYEVPAKFNIPENDYMILATKLYELIKNLRHECIKLDNNTWSNLTISIENVEFLVEYNSDDLNNSGYNSDQRRTIWKYKYLGYPIEKVSKQDRQVLDRFLKEEEYGGHGVTIYSETFFQKHIHNDIQYNEDEENKFIESSPKTDKETKKVVAKNQILN